MNLAMGVRVCMRVFVRENFLWLRETCGPLQTHVNVDDCATSHGAP